MAPDRWGRDSGSGVLLALVVMALWACQPPTATVVIPVRAPAGTTAPPTALRVEIAVSSAPGAAAAPAEPMASSKWARRQGVTASPHGYEIKASTMQKWSSVTFVAWLDVDGDNKRSRGDLEGRLPAVVAEHNGCSSSSIRTPELVLAPIP